MYIQANSKALRSKFVAHQGRMFLEIPIDGGTGSEKRSLRFDRFVQNMRHKMQENIDPYLRELVVPEFSRATKNDRVVASVVFMGAMKNYFSYVARMSCGLPSVTLVQLKTVRSCCN